MFFRFLFCHATSCPADHRLKHTCDKIVNGHGLMSLSLLLLLLRAIVDSIMWTSNAPNRTIFDASNYCLQDSREQRFFRTFTSISHRSTTHHSHSTNLYINLLRILQGKHPSVVVGNASSTNLQHTIFHAQTHAHAHEACGQCVDRSPVERDKRKKKSNRILLMSPKRLNHSINKGASWTH